MGSYRFVAVSCLTRFTERDAMGKHSSFVKMFDIALNQKLPLMTWVWSLFFDPATYNIINAYFNLHLDWSLTTWILLGWGLKCSGTNRSDDFAGCCKGMVSRIHKRKQKHWWIWTLYKLFRLLQRMRNISTIWEFFRNFLNSMSYSSMIFFS